MSEVLRPLKAPPKKRRYLVLDIETKDGETQRAGFTRPFLAGVYDGENYAEFKGRDCLMFALNYVLSKRYRGYYIYAHNGGKFDFLHLLPYLRLSGKRFEILTVGSSIQLLSVNTSENSKEAPWRFVDSYKLIPISLAKAADALGTKKKLVSHDLDLHEDDPRWSVYQRTDCECLYEVLTKFHDLVENKLKGEVGITAAATSMRTFRRTYLSHQVFRHEIDHSFVRQAYYGGRVEVFRKHLDGVRYYDINSCYPYVMQADMPSGESRTEWHGRPNARMRKRLIGFAEASVEYPVDVEFPCLPVRDEQGKLIFPVGSFSGIWPAIELYRAEEQGATVHWGRSVWYSKSPFLAHYTRELYKYRNKSHPDYIKGLELVVKILLNSIYGKFGMKPEKEKVIFVNDGIAPDGAIPVTDDEDCKLFKVPQTVSAPYIIPQVAAHITALARLKLHDYMLLASSRGILAYVDTDGVQTTANLDDLCSSELGSLKDEGQGVVYNAIYLQPKVYLLTGSDGSYKVAMKGYRSRDPAAFRRLQAGGTVEYKTLEKVGTMLRKGLKTGPLMRTVVRQIRSEDSKRVFYADGTSSPIILGKE
jgi:hypothetical protein